MTVNRVTLFAAVLGAMFVMGTFVADAEARERRPCSRAVDHGDCDHGDRHYDHDGRRDHRRPLSPTVAANTTGPIGGIVATGVITMATIVTIVDTGNTDRTGATGFSFFFGF